MVAAIAPTVSATAMNPMARALGRSREVPAGGRGGGGGGGGGALPIAVVAGGPQSLGVAAAAPGAAGAAPQPTMAQPPLSIQQSS